MKKFEGFNKGVDLGGWYSQCDYSLNRLENFINEKDLAAIAQMGLDHVRLPVDYNILEDKDGSQYLDNGFAYIERVSSWCKKYHLNMVLDLHKTAGFSFDSGEAETGFFEDEKLQERFYRLWEKIASVFGGYRHISFELLNEITDKSFSDAWNRISTECIKRIRKIAPETYILLGGYWNNSIDALEDLAMPVDDRVVYNFHCYDPLPFTHQGAYWVPNMPGDFRIKFPASSAEYKEIAKVLPIGSTWLFEGREIVDGKIFDKLFEKAVRIAEERNVALYCGEYGAIALADSESIVNWYKGIHAAFEKYGIARAAWSYREMDFELFTPEAKLRIPELKDLF